MEKERQRALEQSWALNVIIKHRNSYYNAWNRFLISPRLHLSGGVIGKYINTYSTFPPKTLNSLQFVVKRFLSYRSDKRLLLVCCSPHLVATLLWKVRIYTNVKLNVKTKVSVRNEPQNGVTRKQKTQNRYMKFHKFLISSVVFDARQDFFGSFWAKLWSGNRFENCSHSKSY